MCGRIRQARSLEDYQEHLRWNPFTALEVSDGLKYNVPPGTRPIALHRLGKGDDQVDRLFWGYRPAGYRRPPVSNARLSALLKGSPFWKPLLTRRIIVPADGWYEWTGEKSERQPWFISARDEEPVWLAGITAWQPGDDHGPETGFAILTQESAGDMAELHNRRPVCLTPGDALAWVDYTLTPEEALEDLATARPEEDFQWWRVTRAVGSPQYQMPDCAAPVSEQI